MDTEKSLTTMPNQDQRSLLASLSAAADSVAAAKMLADYQDRKSAETLRRQKADIRLFAEFIGSTGVECPDLEVLASWYFITHGLVEAFNRWQLAKSYAIGSINVRLATIRAYCELAAKARVLDAGSLALIKTVKGFRQSEGRNVDEKRSGAGTRTRTGHKKAAAVSVAPVHAAMLKQQDDARDALLACLLLDLGLRCGEIASLDVSSIDLTAGTLTLYRHKVDLWQVHNLTPDTWKAARNYLGMLPAEGPLFVSKLRTARKARIDTRTINHRVRRMGEAIGLVDLSPHDLRHAWATQAMRSGTDVKSLQDAGGWSSPAMPLRYAASAKIANAGVKLS